MARGRWLGPVSAAALTGASVAVLAFNGAHTRTFTIDSYFYLVKARQLSRGLGLHLTWNGGYDRIFSSGYAVWLAPFLAVFGHEGWIVGNVVAEALAALAVWRLLGRLALDPPWRLAAFALTVLNPVWLQWHAIPMAEVLLAASVFWAVDLAFAFRGRGAAWQGIAAAALAGLAAFTRVEGWLVAPVVLAIAWPRLRGRFGLIAAGVALVLLPEGAHRLWLHAHLPAADHTVGYLGVLGRHLHEIDWPLTFRTLVEGPFHPTLEEIAQWRLYRAFMPPALQAAQFGVEALWLTGLLLALTARGWRRTVALVFTGYAALHAFWFYRYERFIDVGVPLAAVVLALGIGELGERVGRRRGALGLAWVAVAICAGYGFQVGRLHAARLDLFEGHRRFAAAAEVAHRIAGDAPVVSDVGPYVAYDLPGTVYMGHARPDFYDDDVPAGAARAGWLKAHGVRAVITARPNAWREPGSRVTAVPPGLWVVALAGGAGR